MTTDSQSAAAPVEPLLRVLIADDHVLFRDGLGALLASVPDMALIGEATSGDEAIALARQLQPDVVLMDIQMPGRNGIEATRSVVQAHGGCCYRAASPDASAASDLAARRGLSCNVDTRRGRAYRMACLMSDNSGLAVQLPPRRHLVPEAAARIRAAIAGGSWPVGSQLPSEPRLATNLGVSRATLREGLRLLISERLLERRPGVGTFVARVPPTTIERGIDELFSLHQTIEQLGHRPSTGACSISFDAQHGPASDELRLSSGDALCRVRRVRLADDRPVILCADYFPRRLLTREQTENPTRLSDEIASAGSLYLWLEAALGASIDSAMAHIESVNCTVEDAAQLELQPGTALLRLRQTHYTKDGQPVLYSDSLHSTAFMHFHVRRRRVSPTF